MPCLLLLLLIASPRIVLFCMWFFTNMVGRTFHGLLLPILGFLFLPLTTIAYVWMTTHHMAIDGINLVIIVVAVVCDLGSGGGGARYRRIRD